MSRIGVDVGGTFTDIVVFEPGSGLRLIKVLTTPKWPDDGVMSGLEKAVQELDSVDALIHATTLGTNLFLGQEGLKPPDAVLITNEGFRDVLELGRQNRPSLYNPRYTRPPPLIPRRRRYGVKGRIGPGGVELEPLDVEAVKDIARRECSQGVRVFIVSLLHSYANPSHEQAARNAILEACPDADVVLSSEVDPRPMEFERTSTSVVNALLKPVLSSYLARLESRLREGGFKGVLLIMQSSGGVARLREALERPAAFIESGPSAGAVAVAYLSRLMNIKRSIGFDMGGTTAKASSIVGGEPEVVDYYEVGGRVHRGRTVRGSGYPVRMPHIDLAEVSAGGGTIAWIDPGGGLRVGPVSAGSDPGPACYGRGGASPTVTDANLVLGRLPETLSGGLRLSTERAREAIRERIARPLGISVEEAAWSIVMLVNVEMARAIRLVSVERGFDPREFTMFAFGGAGPMHAGELARELGISHLVIPPMPGVFSALGLLVADYKATLYKDLSTPASRVSDDMLEDAFQSLEERATEALESQGVGRDRIRTSRFLEAKYWAQAYTLRMPYPGSLEAALQEFHRLHEARYGFSMQGEPIEIAGVRVEAVGLTEKPRLEPASGSEPLEPAGERDVLILGGWERAAVYRPRAPAPGSLIWGPAVVELPDSTILLPPGSRGSYSGHGALAIELG